MEEKRDFKESEWDLARELEHIYAEQLRKLTKLSELITNGHYEALRPLYAVFKELWFEWRVRVRTNELKKGYENKLNRIKELLNDYLSTGNTKGNNFKELINRVDEFHKIIHELMSRIGLAMRSKEYDDEEEEEKDPYQEIINKQRKEVEKARISFAATLESSSVETKKEEIMAAKKRLIKEERKLYRLERNQRAGVYSDL